MNIHIVRRPETIEAELYLYEIADDRRTVTAFNAREDGEVIATTQQREIGRVSTAKPLLRLREEDMRAFIKAVLDHARDEGYKVGDETFAKGKLEAQSDHLRDLRKLLKLP